jgi:hypothetical protein
MNLSKSLLSIILNYILIYYLIIIVVLAEDENNQSVNLEQYLVEKINLELIKTNSGSVLNSINNINNIAYYNGYLYVGAQNWLLKLDANSLKLIQNVQYGPILDSTMCRYYPVEECTFDATSSSSNKIQMDNYNKLLIIYEQRQAILTCWSAKQGTCDLRDLSDLNRIIQTSNIPTVANDPFNSTIGFIASSANSQDLFYTATTYTSQGPYRDDVPALSGRSLSIQHQQQLQFSSSYHNSNNRFMQILTSNSQGLKSSKASIEFISRFMRTFVVKYVTAFNLGIYNYFLSVQHQDTDAMLRGDLLVTKLARLCLNDLSFTKSYTEIPLRCIGGGGTSSTKNDGLRSIDYNELINAKLIQIKSNGFDNLDSNDYDNSEPNYYMIGLFQKTQRNTFNATLPKVNTRQAVCLFSMKQLQAKIKENLRKCYDSHSEETSSTTSSKVVMRGLSFIKSDQVCSSARQHHQRGTSSQINDDFCSSADNGLYPIGGQIPAISAPLIEFDESSNINFDTIQAWSDSIATNLVLMSSKRQELRYFHLKSINSVPINYRIVKLNTRQDKESSIIPVSNLQFENIGTSPPNMFVATDKHIYKLKTSTCESYTTCNECLLKSVNINVIDNNSGGGDPYCGWCNQLNECTTRARCIEQQQMQTQNTESIKWINGAQLLNDSLVSLTVLSSMCVDIDTIEPNLISDETEWIQINFRKALPSFNNSQYQCVYLASNSNETITEAIQITNTKLKCSIPHQTKLKQLFELNLFKQVNNNLLLGEDGLFKQSKLQYYEEKSNQLQLPIYIQNSQLKNVRYGAPLTITSNKELKTLFNLTIINCDAHKSCISCLNSNKQCIWCSNSCVSSTTTKVQKCQNEQQTCESFDTGSTTKLLIPFTQHRQQAPLTLSLLNQASSSDQPKYECMFTMFNGEFLGKNVSLPVVYLNKTHIQCVLTNVFKYLSFLIDSPSIETTTPGQIQTNLRLFNSDNNVFIDSISNGKLALLFYKCEIKANDCSQCLSLNRQLSCMWCGTSNNGAQQQQPSCRFMNSHSKQALNSQCISSLFQKSSAGSFNQCEKPQILDIHPVKLPVGGGTSLIINGINLGTSFEDIIGVSLYCGGGGNINTAADDSSSITNEFVFKCDLLPNKYIPSKQIGCKTRPINSVQHNCRVSVKLKSNFKSSTTSDLLNSAAIQHIFITGSQQVEYVDPIIHEIQPGLVIQSANFVWLTIKGADLDAGRTRQIQIVDYEQQQQHDSRFVKCEIKNVSSSEIKCRLNDKFKILGKKNVKIIFDEYMTIINYLSIRVTTDPLVSAVDKKLTLYAGGSQFYLEGFNFDAVQTAYTYVSFKDIWYSEPVIVRERISNEKMKFEYPALNEAFFQQQKQIINNNNNKISSKFELQIGFLMDGFNVTLKETSIIYVPNFDQITIKNIEIINDKKIQNFNLIIDLDSTDLLFLSSMYFNMLRDDLNVYVACSQCTKINWINETRFTCNLPTQQQQQQHHNRTSACDLKVFNSILTQLNLNKLNLLHFFVGNYELKQQILFEETNENLRLFMKTYQLENIDNYSNLAKQLLQSVNNPNNNLTILNHSLLTLKQQQQQSIIQTSLDESTISRNLILISSIIAGLLVLLIIFIIGIVTVILKTKHKYSNNKYDTTGLSLTHNFLRSGHKSASFSKSKRTNNNSTKSEKKLKLEFERIKKQMEQLEMNARTTCAHLFQQLHQDYVNELNHDMIYTIGLPVWNYKTYLINILFPSSSLSLLNNLLVVNVTNSNLMSNSSMSNSTTNTLVSSNLTPKQQQQSVYATIKSTNMLSLSNDEQFKNHGHVGEAMQLFDQLLHNKTFLLTFIQVCEENSTFTLKDRCHLASLLTICLRDNLPYFYSIVKCLLADYIAQSFSPTHCNNKNMNRSKLLFRSNESLIEPLLTNWISMFMFDFQKDTQCATHLYRLVKVIKFYLDMGPCDEQTQQATNTLNEERLLKEFIQFQPVYVNIVNKLTATTISNTTTTVQICRLLDCDTLNQAKEKILDHLFKKNRTLAPAINNIDLELCLLIVNQDQQQQTTVITLKDTEEELLMATNQQQQPQLVTTNGLKRLLTLKDYNIQNGAFINICIKQYHQQQQQQQHVYMSTLSMNNEYSIYASNQSQKPPVPPIVSPPPLLTNQSQRFHIVRPSSAPTNNNNMLLTFSTTTGSTSLASSSSTETTTDSSQFSTTNKKSNNKKKKYEKLLTVKSQDSGVTTTSLISNSETSNNNNNNSSSILTRLLVNKGTLQPFIDQFLDTLFSNTANLPPVIQHLFEFFDQEIKKYSPNIAQTLSNKEKKTNPNCLNDQLNAMTRLWKTNSYFLRYWINIIKNPDFLLDINKNWLIDSSLTSIAQALIDSCSNTDSHNLYDTNSPINRLLFIKEVPRYKQMIDKFYNEMQSYQPISDHELHFYLNEFAKCQQQQHMSQPIGATINHQTTPNTHVNSELSSIQTLLQLYEYYEKYEQQINASLGKQQCSILLPVHHRLVQIKDLMMTQAGQIIFNNNNNNTTSSTTIGRGTPFQIQQQINYNQHTLNPYQQPMNYYAATNDLQINQNNNNNNFFNSHH